MRRWTATFPLLCFLLAVGVAGCGDPNATRLFVDSQYATRCDVTLHCANTEMRDICGISGGDPCNAGEPQVNASCSIAESGDTRTLTFTASQSADASIRVSGAVFNMSGGSASGGSCQVRVVDGPNTYSGACGSAEPSEAQPCQISAVMFSADPTDGVPVVEGSIFCQFLQNQSNPDLQIEVTAWGSGPTAASTPGYFRIRNCEGQTL